MVRSFIVLRSSAGAGKTHALVKRWLGHALEPDRPDGYRRVLALTFTNKAAGEMKARAMQVLDALASGTTGDGPIEDIRSHLQAEHPSLDLARSAAAMHKHMLHHWSDVAITTIDSFTRRVVKPFARDLQLDGDLEMTTDQEDYRARAVDLLLSEAGRDPELTRLLSRACLALIEDEERWRPDGPLLLLSQELDKESALEHLALLRDLPLDRFLAIESDLRARTHRLREEVREHGQRALDMIAGAGLDEADLAYGRNGPIGWFRKMARFETELDAPGANTRKALGTGKWAASKADDDTLRRVASIAPDLERIVHFAEDLRSDGRLREHKVRSAVLRELLPAAALHLLDERLQRLKREEGVHFFSDLTRRAAGAMQAEPADFIFERIGEKYLHILIDEFQDTSLLQWIALLPLVENVLSNGGSVVLVGDAKQSIYRWRNGEARLIQHLPRLFGRERIASATERERLLGQQYDAPPPLTDNRRSGKAIVTFNNALFAELRNVLPEDLRDVYDAHEQQAFRERSGYVRLEVLGGGPDARADHPGTDEDEGTRLAVIRALEVVRACTTEGFRPGDIALLCRTRTQAAEIAAHFTRNGMPVISPDGMLLGADPGVRLSIDLLRWWHDGSPDAAARAVQRMIALEAGGLSEDALLDPVSALRDWSQRHSALNATLPLTDRLTVLLHALGLPPAGDIHRSALLDEAHAFSARNGSGVHAFLEHWERAGAGRSIELPAHPDAVNVLTIHKSKGLQFPVVVVPFARTTTRSRSSNTLWIDPGPAVPQLPVALAQAHALHDLGIAEVDLEERLRILDELDLLYVAFTRPKERLHAFVADAGTIDGKKRRTDPVGTALFEYIRNNGTGDLLEFGIPEAPEQRAPAQPQQAIDLGADIGAQGELPVSIRRSAPEEWDVSDPDPFRAFGQQVHALMARLRTQADLRPALERCVLTGEFDRGTAIALEGKLAPLLARPDIAPFFNATGQVFTEYTLVDANGGAHRPDRVVEHAGITHVLDIKTGHPSEHHHQQVRTYMRLLSGINGSATTGHLLYLGTGTLEPVEA